MHTICWKNDSTPATLKSDVVYDENLPPFPVDINQPKLMAFDNAAYANDQQKQQYTTVPYPVLVYG